MVYSAGHLTNAFRRPLMKVHVYLSKTVASCFPEHFTRADTDGRRRTNTYIFFGWKPKLDREIPFENDQLTFPWFENPLVDEP